MPELVHLPAALVQALKRAEERVLQAPNRASAWGHLGMLLRANGFAEEGEECFLHAAALAPEDDRWPYLLGVSREPSDPPAALAYYRRALQLRDQPHVRLRLAELLLKQRRLDEAKAHIDAALSQDGHSPRAQYNLARLEFLQSDLHSSLQHARQATAAAPTHRAPQLLLVEIYHRLGRTADADAEARSMQERAYQAAWPDPLIEQVLKLRFSADRAAASAETLASRGEMEAAITLMEQAVSREPEHTAHAVELAQYLVLSGDLPRAAAVLETAALRNPEAAEVRLMQGVVQYRQRQWQRAAASLRESLRLQPHSALAYYNLGQCLTQMGNRQEAVAAFSKAVDLQPGFAEARNRIDELQTTSTGSSVPYTKGR